MTVPEVLLILAIAGVLGYIIHYFFQGSSGKISIRHPVESRIDEYLDRKFEDMIHEWTLVRKSRLQGFKSQRNEELVHNEEHLRMLKEYNREMAVTLHELENRLDQLEKKSSD